MKVSNGGAGEYKGLLKHEQNRSSDFSGFFPPRHGSQPQSYILHYSGGLLTVEPSSQFLGSFGAAVENLQNRDVC